VVGITEWVGETQGETINCGGPKSLPSTFEPFDTLLVPGSNLYKIADKIGVPAKNDLMFFDESVILLYGLCQALYVSRQQLQTFR